MTTIKGCNKSIFYPSLSIPLDARCWSSHPHVRSKQHASKSLPSHHSPFATASIVSTLRLHFGSHFGRWEPVQVGCTCPSWRRSWKTSTTDLHRLYLSFMEEIMEDTSCDFL